MGANEIGKSPRDEQKMRARECPRHQRTGGVSTEQRAWQIDMGSAERTNAASANVNNLNVEEIKSQNRILGCHQFPGGRLMCT